MAVATTIVSAILATVATDEELEEVAGGKQGDRPFDLQACLDDYNPNDWCWFTDKCYGMSVHYSRYGLCKDTYEPQERCAFTDRCNGDTNWYDCRYGT